MSAAATSIPVRNRVVVGCAHHSPYSVLSFLLPRGCTAFWYVELTQSCYLLKIPPHGHFVPGQKRWNGGSRWDKLDKKASCSSTDKPLSEFVTARVSNSGRPVRKSNSISKMAMLDAACFFLFSQFFSPSRLPHHRVFTQVFLSVSIFAEGIYDYG